MSIARECFIYHPKMKLERTRSGRARTKSVLCACLAGGNGAAGRGCKCLIYSRESQRADHAANPWGAGRQRLSQNKFQNSTGFEINQKTPAWPTGSTAPAHSRVCAQLKPQRAQMGSQCSTRTHHPPRTTHHAPRTTHHLPPATCLPPATHHAPPATCHLPATCHAPPATCHLPPATPTHGEEQ